MGEDGDPGFVALAAAYLKEGTDYGADHIPEKAVGADGEDEVVTFLGGVAHDSDVVGGICLPAGLGDGEDEGRTVKKSGIVLIAAVMVVLLILAVFGMFCPKKMTKKGL